jgi:hypothetical protein
LEKSSIYDDGELHVKTDNKIFFDIGKNNLVALKNVSNVKTVDLNGSTSITGSLGVSQGAVITDSITASNHYINNITSTTEGFAMSNATSFSNDATNKIRIFNNNSSSYFDFASSGDSKLHWRYGSTLNNEFLTFNGSDKRVGINKSSPTYALDVNGDINISNLTSKLLFNGGASSIYDNLQLHIQTDDNMYFDIGTTNIIYVNGSNVNINKSIVLPVGQSISWGSNYSKLYDDGDLHVMTDDNMYFDINNTNIISI